MHNHPVEIEFDAKKASSNFAKHGVSFSDAEQALRDPNAVSIDDPDSEGEQRQITVGIDSLGRVLVIVHTQREERTRLISARKASRGEAGFYHAQ